MTWPSLVDSRTMSSSWSLRLPATAGHQVAGGRRLDRDDARRTASCSRFGREVAAVVGRPLLVAERLEAILQVLLELLVELVGLEPERFLVGALAAADDALAQREEELAHAFLAPLRLDELEGGVAEVVDAGGGRRSRRSPRTRVIFGTMSAIADVAHRHQVERVPVRRSCSRPGPRRPTAGGRGGTSERGMMSNSKMWVSSWVIRR